MPFCADETAHAPPPSLAAVRAAAPSPAPPAHAVASRPCGLRKLQGSDVGPVPISRWTFACAAGRAKRFGSAPCARHRHTPRPCRRGAPGPPPCPCAPCRRPRLPAAGRSGRARASANAGRTRNRWSRPVWRRPRAERRLSRRALLLPPTSAPWRCRTHHSAQARWARTAYHSTLIGPRPYPPVSFASTLAFAPMSSSTARTWPNLAAHTSAVQLPTSD